jgi:hypothetical protein
LVCTPDQTAAEECEKKGNSVIELRFGPSHIEFVEEPVEIEEWRGKLV